MKIESKDNLIVIMNNCFNSKNNTWHKSICFDNLFYWSPDGLEFGMFPVYYATIDLLNNVSVQLFGIKGRVLINEN